MSVSYPVPTPITAKRVAHAPLPYADKTFILPAAPLPPSELPSLVMAPLMPPQGPRL